jgi:hypothetical protein
VTGLWDPGTPGRSSSARPSLPSHRCEPADSEWPVFSDRKPTYSLRRKEREHGIPWAFLQADATVTGAAANVCGSGCTISAGAARYGTNAGLYLWWNGKYNGSNKLYDKCICGVLFNDTGYTMSGCN